VKSFLHGRRQVQAHRQMQMQIDPVRESIVIALSEDEAFGVRR
jgi:hypothetical protein